MVIDTSIFIEFLRAKDKTKTRLYKIPSKDVLYVSTVTLFELYAGANSEIKKRDVDLITEDVCILNFTEKAAKIAGEIFLDLKINNKIIEFRDILIAATALANDDAILTLNQKHFSRIAGLRLI